MKIICSSLALEKAIGKALKSENNSIKKVKISCRYISFGKIKVQVATNDADSGESEIIFYPVQWYKVMQFIKQVPEQPITLTIDSTGIEVYCVATF